MPRPSPEKSVPEKSVPETSSLKKSVTEFTDANFESEVLQSEEPVIVDFWAESCAPCRLMHPVVAKLARALGSRAKVGRLDVFANPQTTEALSIKGIPYMIVVRAGEVVLEMIGDRSYEDLVARLDGVV